MKKILIILLLVGLPTYYFLANTESGQKVTAVAKATVASSNVDYIHKEGAIVKDRVITPEGFERITYSAGSFQSYIQNYKLKPYGAKVINYDGSEYFLQTGHVGVLEIPVPKNGLQQCADALIRIRAEYLWENNRKDEIGFNFTSGHYCSWKKYAEGYRPKIKGSKVSFHKTASANSSKENFYKYLNLIYTYSGTISLFHEMPKVAAVNDLEVGDMLIYAGSPGHVVMIVDAAKNEKGDKIFIIAQGNTPAQNVHMLKNVTDDDLSPWYQFEMGAFTEIPAYYFEEARFVRFKE